MNKQEAKQQIQKLVEKYERVREAGKVKSYNEAQTRNEFIEPLFEFLGWDMRNLTADNEVTTEENVSGGRVDLAFRLGNIPVIFLEAKAMKVDLDEGKWAEQAINYSWNKGVTWAVLTDFESVKIFNAEIPPKSISQNLFIELSCLDFINRFDQLWLLSKESFEQKLLDKEAEKWGKLTQKKQVGEKLFEDLMSWRISLTKEFKKRNDLTEEELDEGVQRILDRLIFIRTAEDRRIEPKVLLGILRGGKASLYKQLTKVFRDFDDGYNSELFAPHYCEKWEADDKVFAEIINGLHETRDGYRYDFSAISADVLGGMYEQYLSYVQGRKSEDKQKSKRKSQGIYYTPKYIVEYIVKETLGEVLKKTKPKEIAKIKVLDPACGSGSFLTTAYDKILETLAKQNPQTLLFTQFNILKENIFGVDLDAQAVEIARLNLLLKVLSQKTKLPTLQHNVNPGNSLVSGNAETLEKYFEDKWREQKPFNFKEEFKEVFEQDGFDAVIGNPPYVQLSMEEKLPDGLKDFLLDTYKSSMGRLNTFGFFIKRGVELLKDGGYLGFIIPNTILTQDYYEELRKDILETCAIESIVSFDDLPFKAAVVENVVLILKKTKSERVRNNNRVEVYKVNQELPLVRDKSITQKLFSQSHKCSFAIHIDESRLLLKKELEEGSSPLSKFLDINQAIALKHERAKYLSQSKDGPEYKPVIDGRNINRYSVNWDKTYLRYDINAIHSCKREDIFLTKEKLFFRRVGDRLIGAYDDKQLYALNTLVVMNLKDDVAIDIKYFLALFNSKLLNWYYQFFLKSTKKVFSEIQARQVSQLPIKHIDLSVSEDKERHTKLVALANKMTCLNNELQKLSPNTDQCNRINKEIEKTDSLIDEEVYKLYGLTPEEIEIVEGKN